MSTYDRLRPGRIGALVSLLASRVTRETVSATGIRRVEPADGRFDTPPDDLPWQPFKLGQSWGTKQRWT